MRRNHPRNRRHRGINRGALPCFSVLEFHPELQVEKEFVTADINKFFHWLRGVVRKRCSAALRL